MKEIETEEDEVKSDAELYSPFIAVLPCPKYCPNVNLAKPHNMATILNLQDSLAFFDLKLNFHKGHTSAAKRKEMAYELWADNIFSTHGLYTDV